MSLPRTTAVGTAALAVTGLLVAAPLAAGASPPDQDPPIAYAEGAFLTGTLVGDDLARVLDLDPATAVNHGDDPVAQEANPFSATALRAVTVAPGTTTIGDAPGIDAGVIGQHAIARPDGTSYASSGLLGANGAVSVSPGSGAMATIDLAALLGDALPTTLAGLRVEAVGLAAEAEAAIDGVRGDSALADARLVLEVPAIAAIDDEATAAFAPIADSLADLGADDGQIGQAVDGLLTDLGLDGLASVTIDVDAQLLPILDSIADTVLRDPALTIDIGSGVVAVDLAALPAGPRLDELAPGTELLSDHVVADVVGGVDRLLGDYLDELAARLLAAVESAHLTVEARASVLDDIRTGETVRTVSTPVTQIVDAVTGRVLGILDPETGTVSSLDPAVSGDLLSRVLHGLDVNVLGGLLGGDALPEVTTRVVDEVTEVVEPVFSALETSADLRIETTLAEAAAGTAAVVDARAMVLGSPVDLDASLVLGSVADAVSSSLLGAGGAADDARGAMDPASPSARTTGDSLAAIGDLVSLQANVHERTPGTFTQTALRVSLLDGELATIDLANATVGTSATGPTGPTDDAPATAAAPGTLAYTGFALGLIVLLGVGCLAAGAYTLWRSRAIAAADVVDDLGA